MNITVNRLLQLYDPYEVLNGIEIYDKITGAEKWEYYNNNNLFMEDLINEVPFNLSCCVVKSFFIDTTYYRTLGSKTMVIEI